ncbi:hypothetical protein FB45DRAFT_1010513 [Roridomyces roridus]|uniref:Uncharacterized protein n=1 Tax=Roridomyces roridus TaxID=1738132 RepID=A0AAD7FB71_9AGAR|nr:hypothetical protein FB45DRAFT_1010513 [Roridomyces roridus]
MSDGHIITVTTPPLCLAAPISSPGPIHDHSPGIPSSIAYVPSSFRLAADQRKAMGQRPQDLPWIHPGAMSRMLARSACGGTLASTLQLSPLIRQRHSSSFTSTSAQIPSLGTLPPVEFSLSSHAPRATLLLQIPCQKESPRARRGRMRRLRPTYTFPRALIALEGCGSGTKFLWPRFRTCRRPFLDLGAPSSLGLQRYTTSRPTTTAGETEVETSSSLARAQLWLSWLFISFLVVEKGRASEITMAVSHPPDTHLVFILPCLVYGPGDIRGKFAGITGLLLPPSALARSSRMLHTSPIYDTGAVLS